MITLDNKKVHDWIVTKDELVTAGRKISAQIEDIERKVKAFEKKEQELTSKVIPPKELTDKGDEVAQKIAKLSDELDAIAREVHDTKLQVVPKDMKEKHLKLLKDKEVLERERNKIALKVQKIKDKLIPIVQREVTPLIRKENIVPINIGKFDDIETAKAKDGKVVINTFNHLNDWMRKFR